MARIRNHANPFHYINKMTPIDFNAVFCGFNGKIDLEIGFGRGVFLEEYARSHPERHLVGVEVRKPMVEIVQESIVKAGLQNVAIFHGTAERLIEDAVQAPIIERVFLFHPDPWLKKRHHKRRVIQIDLLQRVASKMLADGRLYVSTDVSELFDYMDQMITESRLFEPVDNDGFWREMYDSNWRRFCVADLRETYCRTYQRLDRI